MISAKSIAVLPFENLSHDNDDEYFVAGMQDLLLAKLSDIAGLKVIARASTAGYGSHPADLKTVGEQLYVATIVEGSVRKAGNEVSIDVQLIDVQTGARIWAQAWVRKLDNSFGLASAVAEQIADALNVGLTDAQRAQLAAIPTRNPDAYGLFLRAEYQTARGDVDFTTANWKAAISLYRQAITHDQRFALAYAWLSYVESHLAWFGGAGENVQQLAARARSDAARAVKLTPDLAAARVAIGYSAYWGRGDYAAALKAFDAALALSPNDANAAAALGYVERRLGRFDAAITSLQQALAHDPRNSGLAYDVGITCMMIGRYAETETWFRRALTLDPDNHGAKVYNSSAVLFHTGNIARALTAAQGNVPALKLQRVTLLTLQRKYREAIALLESVPDTPDNFQASGGGPKAQKLADLQRLVGNSTKTHPLFEQALTQVRAQRAQVHGISLASVWHNIADAELGLGSEAKAAAALAKSQAIVTRTGDKVYGPALMEANAALYAEARRPDLAVPLLAKALATPGIGDVYAPVLLWLDPAWDPIRHDSRFQALLKKCAKYKPAGIHDIPLAAAPTVH